MVDYSFQKVQFTRPPTDDRRRGQFKQTYDQVFRQLSYELHKINVDVAIIGTDHPRNQVRIDGKPRGEIEPATPRVSVSFDRGGRTITMQCDAFTQWMQNLKAIAMTLEALRACDRYGATSRGEQYRGFEALPPGGGGNPFTRETAARWMAGQMKIACNVGIGEAIILGNSVEAKACYRKLAAKFHPDQNGGQSAQFIQLGHAKEALGL